MNALYFLALLVPDPLALKIQEIKVSFSEKYHTRHGLKTVPHITIVPPFRESEMAIQKRIERSAEIAARIAPFEISLSDYATFGKHVLYIHVVPGEKLESVFQKFKVLQPSVPDADERFRPHITIAHRDLKPGMMTQAWKEYKLKKFRETFQSESISWLVLRDGSWEVERTIRFEAASQT